eukprot:330963-Chlamydomonas_euryale.AAC.1
MPSNAPFSSRLMASWSRRSGGGPSVSCMCTTCKHAGARARAGVECGSLRSGRRGQRNRHPSSRACAPPASTRVRGHGQVWSVEACGAGGETAQQTPIEPCMCTTCKHAGCAGMGRCGVWKVADQAERADPMHAKRVIGGACFLPPGKHALQPTPNQPGNPQTSLPPPNLPTSHTWIDTVGLRAMLGCNSVGQATHGAAPHTSFPASPPSPTPHTHLDRHRRLGRHTSMHQRRPRHVLRRTPHQCREVGHQACRERALLVV